MIARAECIYALNGPNAWAINLPAMSAHNLHDECALMRIGRADDRIDCLDDPMQCRIGADGHVRSAEVIVNGPDHAGNVQHAVFLPLLRSDFAVFQQFVQQTAPFLPEQVGAGQRAIATDDHLRIIIFVYVTCVK